MEVCILITVRVQEKGQITIPSDIRKKLRSRKGDLVTFMVKEDDVVIQTVKTASQELLERLERSLNIRGYTLEMLLNAFQRIGGELAGKQFGLSEEEKSTLYMALQLQAEQALEAIRNQAEKTGQDRLSEEEIEAEIQAIRNKASRTPGS